jgi:hypothetical protein
MPNTPEGPSASAPGSQTPSMAFTAHKPARHPLFHLEGRGCDDACSGFTHVTDRTVAPAPLRTRPLDHARGHSYQGPRHLPGPDSHRPAVLNLSLDLRHDELHLLTTPKQSGRTCATASRGSESASRASRQWRELSRARNGPDSAAGSVDRSTPARANAITRSTNRRRLAAAGDGPRA